MAVEETLVNERATGAQVDENASQVQENTSSERVYTQDEVDNMMARMRGAIENKVLKPYKELGDPEELRQMKTQAEQRRQQEQIERGEFEKTLQELAEKKDSEIQKRDAIIKEYKLNTPLLNAAAKYKSVNPDQVKSLLQNSLTLDENGDAVVVDSKGAIQYDDSGKPKGVENLVQEFLAANPHFVQPSASTTNTSSNTGVGMKGDVDISKLDMKNPEHRKLYAQMRKAK
jgi:hypothetical protein